MKHPRSPEDDEPQEAPRNVRRRTEMTWYQTNIQSLRQQQIERLKDFGSEILSLDPNDPATPEMVYWTECNRRVRAQRKTDLVYPSLDFGGEVVGMGSNDSSLLGFEQKADENGDALESEHPPVLVPGDCIPQGQITQVCVGGSHTVVLGADGTCYSWGVSDEGALGRGDDKDQPIIGQIDIENVIQVAAGDTHTVFLDIEGRVWISGMHRHNEAGNWRYAEKANELKKGRANFTPVLVKGLDNVVKIGAGGDISAALTSDGTLYTWGLGVSGELARSKKMGAPTTQAEEGIPGHSQMIPYTTYDYFKPMMGRTEIDDKGQPHFVVDKEKLHKNYLVPTPVEWKDDEPPVEIVDFAIGKYHIIVLGRKKGEYGTRVYSAGGNANGQLGLGHYRQEHALTEIKELSTKRIGGVSAGTYHCIAVGMTGEEVYTWGNAISGRLGISDGDPPMKTYPLPQKVAFPDSFAVGDRVVDVTCGEETTFAVTAHGHLYVWGYNVYSQTGFNCNYGDIYRPRKMDPMDSIKLTNPGAKQCHVLRVASGAQHTMLLIKRYE